VAVRLLANRARSCRIHRFHLLELGVADSDQMADEVDEMPRLFRFFRFPVPYAGIPVRCTPFSMM
jgi:hypothetical protein